MFLEFVTLLILVIVVISHILLDRKLTDDRVMQMVDKTNVAALAVLDVTQLLVDHQNILNDKMNALSMFVDKHSNNVVMQQKFFDALAKADVLAARREELLRTKELKIALERLMGIALTSRQPPASNDILALENLTRRIGELESILEVGDNIDNIMN